MNTTGDMAGGFAKIQPEQFRGYPCFKLDSQDEYNSFCKGVKSFRRWARHTKSEEVRQWANKNPYKDFYITHNGSYTFIKRSKK